MKRLNLILSIGAAIACALAAGCSKSNEGTTAQGAGSSGGVQADSGAPVTMKMKWQVGKQYDQEMAMTQTSRINVPGIPQPIDQTMKMIQDFTVSALKATPDGGTELELKFTGQKISSKMGEQTVLDFDSSKPASEDGKDPSAPMFRKMIGAHLKYLMDANGKLVKIEGMDEFLSQMSGGDPQASAMIKGLMSENTLKQLVERGQGLPEKPVKVGDAWPVNLEVDAAQAGIMKMNMTYTFKGWEDHDGHKCALLDFSGDITSTPKANPNGMQVSVDKGKISGKSWFDPALEIVLETDSDQTMTLKISAQGKTMDSQMQQNVSTKIVKVSDLPK